MPPLKKVLSKGIQVGTPKMLKKGTIQKVFKTTLILMPATMDLQRPSGALPVVIPHISANLQDYWGSDPSLESALGSDNPLVQKIGFSYKNDYFS